MAVITVPMQTKTEQQPRLVDEWSSVLVLILLYALQGVPLGLSMGSMCVINRRGFTCLSVLLGAIDGLVGECAGLVIL